MKLNDAGIPRFTDRYLYDLIYSGGVDKLDQVLCEDSSEIQKFNRLAEEVGNGRQLQIYKDSPLSPEEIHKAFQNEWFMPDAYIDLDIEAWLFRECKSKEQHNRIKDELAEFKNRDLYNLLRFLKYMVDFMRKERIIWGVGRGSSVASYVLYLIGINRIDPLKYDLDWKEFLR